MLIESTNLQNKLNSYVSWELRQVILNNYRKLYASELQTLIKD